MNVRFLLFGVGAMALLSGCLGQPDLPEEGTVPENPAEKFDELMQKNRDAWADDLVARLPEFLEFKKYASDFSFSGEAQIPELGGSLSFDISANGENDLSDPEIPLGKTDISISGSVLGMISGSAAAKASVIFAEKSIFVSLQDFSFDFPMIPSSQIVDPLKPIFGKWYGDTLEKIAEATGGEFDSTSMPNIAQIQDEIVTIIKTRKIWKMKSAEPVANGQYVFAVELDKEELKAAILDFLASANIPENDISQVKSSLDSDLSQIEVFGNLTISAQNPKDFRFEGTVQSTSDVEGSSPESADVIIVMNEGEKTFSVTEQAKNHILITVISQDGKETFEISVGNTSEENYTVLSGFRTDDTVEMTFSDPDSGEEMAKLMLSKEDKKWSGTVVDLTNQDSDVIAEISDLEKTSSKIAAKVILKNGGTSLGSFEMSYSLEEKTSISITAPSDFEPFENLEPVLEEVSIGLMGGGMSQEMTPGEMTPPGDFQQEMTDEEIEAMMQGMDLDMSEEELQEMMGAIGSPETPSDQ